MYVCVYVNMYAMYIYIYSNVYAHSIIVLSRSTDRLIYSCATVQKLQAALASFCRLRGALQHSEDQMIRLQQGGDPQIGSHTGGTIPVVVIGLVALEKIQLQLQLGL